MKILQVISVLAQRYGGPSFVCKELSQELVQQGHEVSVYTTNVDGPGHLEVPVDRPIISGGVKIHYFPGWNLPGKFVVSSRMWRALRDTVTEFDVVHVYGVYGFTNSAAAYWCRGRSVPYMLYPHGSLDPFLRRRHRPRKWLYTKLLGERDYQHASAVLFHSAEEMRLASDWAGLKARARNSKCTAKRFVIYAGIGAEWLKEPDSAAGERFRSRFPELKTRRLIVCLGRINFKKGLDILARAFAKIACDCEDLHLVLAGPDNEGYGARVRQWLAEGGVLKKTTFTGMLEGEDRLAVMQQAEVFALPSYTENFGLVIAEAMASSVPVVVSDRVNIWREVSEAGAGLVVPCDVEATAQALRSLLNDPVRGRQMGRNGHNWVAKHLAWKAVGAEMARVYEEIVRDHKASGKIHAGNRGRETGAVSCE